jgi:hypothetical protein
MQYTVIAKKKLEGIDLRKSESGVVRFMGYMRGGGEVYILPGCLLIMNGSGQCSNRVWWGPALEQQR